jgi:hypothetical protein
MTSGTVVSVSESERAALLGWAVLLGRTGASERAGHAAGPSRRKEGKATQKESFCFSFFKNANSVSICLFH